MLLKLTFLSVHVVPDWYRALVPNTGGAATPAWDLASHLNFMNSNGTFGLWDLFINAQSSFFPGIKCGIISISAPASGVYPGSEILTTALARLLNEVYDITRKFPI